MSNAQVASSRSAVCLAPKNKRPDRTAPAFVTNQTQRTMNFANQYRPAVVRCRAFAPFNQDQTAFFDTARNYAQQAMNREAPEIDTSALEDQLGRTVDTSGIDRLIELARADPRRRAWYGRAALWTLAVLEDAAAQSVSTTNSAR